MRLIAKGWRTVDVVVRNPAMAVPVSPTSSAKGWVLMGIVPDNPPTTEAVLEDLLPDWKIVMQDKIGNESPAVQLGDGFHPHGEALVGYQQLGPAFGVNERGFYTLAKEHKLPLNAAGDYEIPACIAAILYGQRIARGLGRRAAQPRDPRTKRVIKGALLKAPDEAFLDSIGEMIKPFQARLARDLKRKPQLLSYRQRKARDKMIKELEAAQPKKQRRTAPVGRARH
jgi:hypothetical protein